MPPPTNPGAAAAAASGPGKYSQRTDGGPQAGQTPNPAAAKGQSLQQLPNAKYGENKSFQDIQRGAPLAQTNQAPNTPTQGFAPNPAAPGVVPFSAPTQSPQEPVTAGAALGPGGGPEMLSSAPDNVEQQDNSKLAGYVNALETLSNFPDSLPGSRMLVNALKAKMQ